MKSKKEEVLFKLNTILAKSSSSKFKIAMIQALIDELKPLASQKSKEVVETCQSQMPNDPFVSETDIQQLEDKIMKKRSVKFELNEEVEGVEDELYEIEKVIQTKKMCDDKMRRQIDKKMLMIQWSQQRMEKPKPIVENKQKNKTLGHISMKLKNLFG